MPKFPNRVLRRLSRQQKSRNYNTSNILSDNIYGSSNTPLAACSRTVSAHLFSIGAPGYVQCDRLQCLHLYYTATPIIYWFSMLAAHSRSKLSLSPVPIQSKTEGNKTSHFFSNFFLFRQPCVHCFVIIQHTSVNYQKCLHFEASVLTSIISPQILPVIVCH